MVIKRSYKALKKQSFVNDNYTIVPIRFEDRYNIMKWRNEQIYHLRQAEPLTKEDQDKYFKEVVGKQFNQDKPDQILFSYLKNGECIGYGGLVHINWTDRNAEISFIMKTELEKDEFSLHWRIFLDLIEEVAFQKLELHKIFTYAFNLRPHLYKILESKRFVKEAVLREHCFFGGEYKDVIIHSRFKNPISIRAINMGDLDFTYFLSNDPLTRSNSYNSNAIPYYSHEKWFKQKLQDPTSFYFIGQFNAQPAAFIRIDISEEENIVGITLHKNFRGMKLSSKFLQQSVQRFKERFPDKILTAYIKIENIPSIKTFEKAGFRLKDECTVENSSSKRYII